MSRQFFCLLVWALVCGPVLIGRGQAPDSVDAPSPLIQIGRAGIYPPVLQGRITASGLRYDPDEHVAAHRTLPFGSVVRVTNADNSRSVVVRVIDRGPYTQGRVMDLSSAAARRIGLEKGDHVRVERVSPDVAARASRARIRARTAAAEEEYTIQLGTFSDPTAAERIPGRIDGTWLQRLNVDGQTLYRVNYQRFDSRERASEDLPWLAERGFTGFVRLIRAESEYR